MGKQLKIHGNVVCVPADVSTTVSMLPRTSSDMETIAVKLKQRSQYEHAFVTANIRPECVRQVGKYLSQHGHLFKTEKISFSTAALTALQTSENFIATTDDNIDPAISDDTNFKRCHTDLHFFSTKFIRCRKC